MDLSICVCFLAFFTYPLVAEELDVYFENGTRIDVSDGATMVKFKCHLNKDALFVVQNDVTMIHKNPKTGEETIISKSADLVEGKPEFYDIKIDSGTSAGLSSVVMELTILKVRYWDDGIYICKVQSESGESAVAEREIVVHRPMSSFGLKFGDSDLLTETPSDPIRVDHGTYDVSCIAEGSNPATEDVHMFLHGEMVGHGKAEVTPMDGPERKFRTSITGNLNIMVSNSGQEIECQAKDSSGSSKSVKLTFIVNIYDAEVTCNDTHAHLGEANPTLICTVNHTGLDVEGYAYQMGDTGEIFRPEVENDKNIVVTVSNVDEDVTIVSLDLHKALSEYLDQHFYILIDLKGGHTTKERVRLHKKEVDVDDNPSDGAARVSATFLCVLMCIVLWTL